MNANWVRLAPWLALVLTACVPRALTPLPGLELKSRPADAASTAGTTATAASAPEDPRLRPLSEDKPAQITSDRMSYSEQGRVTVFQGRVRVRQETMRVETPYLEVRSEDGRALARRGVRIIDHARGLTVTAQELEYRQNLTNATARGRVHLDSHDSQGQPLQMRSERLDWDQRLKEALAGGSVQVNFRGATATAESMRYRQDEQKVELTGAGNTLSARPQIEQEGNTITGDVILLRLSDRVYEVTGSARAELTPKGK